MPSKIKAKNNQVKIAKPIPLALSLVNIDDKNANAVKTNVIKVPTMSIIKPTKLDEYISKGKPAPIRNDITSAVVTAINKLVQILLLLTG